MKTCLLVDDSRTIRALVKPMLTDLGFQVMEAGDGQQALNACDTQIPDVVLLDWNMPVMNGLEFLKAFRARPDGQSALVVFCTTESSIDHIRIGLEAGANEYIMKPFDREILQDKLAEVGAI